MLDVQPNLYDLELTDLEALLKSWEEAPYRARQIWEWLYCHKVTSIEQMTSLPKSLRERLQAETRLPVPHVLDKLESLDGETRKDLLELEDREQVEVVLMRYIERRSACISTQIGCSVGCKFCATGQMGFKRNLTSGEMMMQVLHVAREVEARGKRLSNVVLMGMGEPLLNYNHTLAALRRMVDHKGFQMGQRRITLSTSGIVPGIYKLAEEQFQINLAVSLHAATDELRNQLMPINRRYNLNDLMKALSDYIAQTNRRVMFEWVLIEGVNDTPEQAEALAARVAGMLVHVNLIPLNPTEGFEGQPSSPERMDAFVNILDRHHIPHTLRLRRGTDIVAGCGQLRQRS